MIEASALGIEEPAVFIEIAAHVSDMNPEHVFVFIGSARMRMYDGPLRMVKGQIVPMNPTG